MNIRTETTPNPATLKFLPNRAVMASGTANFPDSASAARSPLAESLFAVEGVSGVFLGADFITVAKSDTFEWATLIPVVGAAIAAHFDRGLPVVDDGMPAEAGPPSGQDDEVVAQIRELIETRVRPVVAMDGGDIQFQGYENGIVYLYMQGSCAGCPSATATLKIGIENMLKHYVPEVLEVRAAY